MVMVALSDQIKRTTDKAILVDFCERQVWLPISQTNIDDDGLVWCKTWIAAKNGILPSQQYRPCFVG